MVDAISMAQVQETAAVQNKLAAAATKATLDLLPDDFDVLSPEIAGGVLRTVASGVLEQFETTASVVGKEQYTKLAQLTKPNFRARTAEEIAFDERQRAVQLAWDEMDRVAKVTRADRVDIAVGYSMKKYSQGLYVDVNNTLASTMGRQAGNAFREAIKTAALNDERSGTFQRVASATACAFCLVVSLNEYTSFDEDGGYHDDCGCTTVPVFKGNAPVRPDYYDEFEATYTQGRADSVSDGAGDILAAIRASTGRK